MPAQPRKPATKAKKTEPTAKRKRTSPASPAAPQPVANEDRYAPTAWGGGTGSGPTDLEMPSGQIALVRRPGLQQLMIEGVLHKMDNLTSLVDKKYIKKGLPAGAKPSDAIDVGGLMNNPEALAEIMHTVDRVVCAVVVRPMVSMTPNDPTRRVPGVIYADSIGIEDRMFIFNYAIGASKDLESFRRETEAVVGSLAIGEPVASEAE